MAHVTGKRISRSHTTATDLAERIARMLDQSGLITKVSLTVIDARAHAKVIKVTVNFDLYGLRVTAQEPSARQELYVSAPDREMVIARIEKWCQDKQIKYIVRR